MANMHQLLKAMIEKGASDLHITTGTSPQLRIDGKLHPLRMPPLSPPETKQLCYSVLTDSQKHHFEEDNELDLSFSVQKLSRFRANVFIQRGNVAGAFRAIPYKIPTFEELGLPKIVRELSDKPRGLVLVTGPTGSGKTTSLYAALNALNTPDRKIITAEDPVEYYLPGINQVEIRHSIGLDFARVIRAMLRQAPNIILVGEMRDLETAQMGIQASLTGHLVFSTLHTNDAPSAITRLIDMGVPSYLVSSSVVAIMAQRLVRVVCQKCKHPYTPSESALRSIGITPEMAAEATFMKGKGCGTCQGSGYRGRLALFELMIMSSKVRELTFNEASTAEIRRAARAEGMSTLFGDGVMKACKGITTIEEVVRVAKQAE